jgi:hypothetical protein
MVPSASTYGGKKIRRMHAGNGTPINGNLAGKDIPTKIRSIAADHSISKSKVH